MLNVVKKGSRPQKTNNSEGGFFLFHEHLPGVVEQINHDLKKNRLPEIKFVSFFEKTNSCGAQKAYDGMVSVINDYMPKDGDEPQLLLIWHARCIKLKKKDTKSNIHAFPLVLANHNGKNICVFGSITTPELILACQAICNGSDDVTFYMPNHGVQHALLTCDTLAMMILSRLAISNDIGSFIASLPAMNDTVTTPKIMDKIAKARDDVAKYAKAEVLSIAPIMQENFKKNRIIGYSMPNFLKVCCQNVATLESIPNGSVVSMPKQEVQTKEDFMEKYFNNETKVNNYTSIWSLETASKYIPGYDKLSVRYYYRPKISDATVVNPNIPQQKVKQYKPEKEKVTSQMTNLSIVGKVMPTSGFNTQHSGSVSNNAESISWEKYQHAVTDSVLAAAADQRNPYVSNDDTVEYDDTSYYKSDVMGNGNVVTIAEEDAMMPHLVKEEYKYETDIADQRNPYVSNDDTVEYDDTSYYKSDVMGNGNVVTIAEEDAMMPHLVKEEYKYETDIADQRNPYVSNDDTVEYDVMDYRAEVAEKDEQIINSEVLDLSGIVDAKGNRLSHEELIIPKKKGRIKWKDLLEKVDRNSLEIIESIINDYKIHAPIRHHPIVHKIIGFIKANQLALFDQKERWSTLFYIILDHHNLNKDSDRDAFYAIIKSLRQVVGLGMISLDFEGLVGFDKRQLDESLKIDIPRSLKISTSGNDAVYISNRIAFDVLTEAIKSYPDVGNDAGTGQKVSSFDTKILQFVKNNRKTMLSNQDGWIKALMLLGAKNDNKNRTVSDKKALRSRLKSIIQGEKKVTVVPDGGTDTIDLSKIVDVKGNKVSYKAFTFPNWQIHGSDVKPAAWLELVDKNVLDGLIEIVKEYPDDTKNTRYPAMVRRFESFIQRNRYFFSNQNSHEKEKWRMLFLVLLQHCGLGTHPINQLICGKLRIKKLESLEISFNGLVRFDGSNIGQGLSINATMQAKEGYKAVYDENQIAFAALKEAINSYPVARTGYNAGRTDLDIKISAFTEHNKSIMSKNTEYWSTILRILSVVDEGKGAKIASKRSLNETIRSILKVRKDTFVEFDLSKLVDRKGKSELKNNIIEVPLGVKGYKNPQLSFVYNKHRCQFDLLRQFVDGFASSSDETRIKKFIGANMEYLLKLGDASRTVLYALISKCYPHIYEDKVELGKVINRFQSYYNAVINGESYEQYRMRYKASAALKYGMDTHEYNVAARKRTAERKGLGSYGLEVARKKAHDIFEQYGVDWMFGKSRESPMSRLPDDVVSADVTPEDLEDLAQQLLIMTGIPSQISANNLKNNIIKQWREAIMLRTKHGNKLTQQIKSTPRFAAAIARGATGVGSANTDYSVWPANNDSDSSHDSLDWAVSMPKKARLSTSSDMPSLQAKISSPKEMLTRVRMKLARYKYHGETDEENAMVSPSTSSVKQQAFWRDKEVTQVNSSKNSIAEYSELDEMSLSNRLMLKKERNGSSKQVSDDCSSLDDMPLSRRLRLKRKANFSSFRL